METEIREQIFMLLIHSLAVASVAWTVTQEEIFSEFREYCVKQCKKKTRLLERKFFYVFTCEYCLSFWVTVLFLIMTGFRLVFNDWRGNILAFFVIPWIANQWMSLYRRLRVEIKHVNAQAEKEETQSEGEDPR